MEAVECRSAEQAACLILHSELSLVNQQLAEVQAAKSQLLRAAFQMPAPVSEDWPQSCDGPQSEPA